MMMRGGPEGTFHRTITRFGLAGSAVVEHGDPILDLVHVRLPSRPANPTSLLRTPFLPVRAPRQPLLDEDIAATGGSRARRRAVWKVLVYEEFPEPGRCRLAHVLRRSFATLAHDSGASLKDVQAQLRHSHVSTAAEVYTQAIPESVRATVEAFSL